MNADDLLSELEGDLRVSSDEIDNDLTDMIDRPSRVPGAISVSSFYPDGAEELDDYINQLLEEDGDVNELPDDAEEFSQSTLLHLVDRLVNEPALQAGGNLTLSDEERFDEDFKNEFGDLISPRGTSKAITRQSQQIQSTRGSGRDRSLTESFLDDVLNDLAEDSASPPRPPSFSVRPTASSLSLSSTEMAEFEVSFDAATEESSTSHLPVRSENTDDISALLEELGFSEDEDARVEGEKSLLGNPDSPGADRHSVTLFRPSTNSPRGLDEAKSELDFSDDDGDDESRRLSTASILDDLLDSLPSAEPPPPPSSPPPPPSSFFGNPPPEEQFQSSPPSRSPIISSSPPSISSFPSDVHLNVAVEAPPSQTVSPQEHVPSPAESRTIYVNQLDSSPSNRPAPTTSSPTLSASSHSSLPLSPDVKLTMQRTNGNSSLVFSGMADCVEPIRSHLLQHSSFTDSGNPTTLANHNRVTLQDVYKILERQLGSLAGRLKWEEKMGAHFRKVQTILIWQ